MYRPDAGNDLHRLAVKPGQSLQSLVDEMKDYLARQHTPVLVVLPEQPVQVFHRPEDFLAMNHLKHEMGLEISFIIPTSGSPRDWAERCGFAVYASQEEFEEKFQNKSASMEEEEEEEEEVAQPSLEIPPLFSTLDFFDQKAEARDDSSSPFFEIEDDGNVVLWDVSTTVRAKPASRAFNKDRFTTPIPRSFVPAEKSVQNDPSSALSPQLPDKSTSPPPLFRKLRRVGIALVVLIALGTLLSAGALLSLRKPETPAASSASVGYVYFQSSNPLNQAGVQGLNDSLQIELNHLATPGAGESYHAWLLGDTKNSDVTAIYLGQMDVTNGSVHFVYTDPGHTNLLATFSRFLVTEDSSQIVPSYPADQSTWRYEGTISQIPDPNDTVHHFSILDHLRHLLAADPVLNQLGLKGGLAPWFSQNSAKLLTWTENAQDTWTTGSTTPLRRQVISILDDLDGLNEVQADLPSGTPFLIDRVQYRLGLLELGGGVTDQPGLIYHMETHLASLDLIPERTSEQHMLVRQIVDTLNNVQSWLQQMRLLATQLLTMNDTQLRSSQAHALLNSLAVAANNAIYGTMNVATGNVQAGAMWIETTMQRLAIISIIQL